MKSIKGILTNYCRDPISADALRIAARKDGGGEHLKLYVRQGVVAGPASAHGRSVTLALDCYEALHLAQNLLVSLPHHYLERDENFGPLRAIVDKIEKLREREGSKL